MPLQAIRRANLCEVIRQLERSGIVGWVALAERLDNPVTPARLQGMAEGREISAWFAAHVEHALGKPRGWMDEPREPESLA